MPFRDKLPNLALLLCALAVRFVQADSWLMQLELGHTVLLMCLQCQHSLTLQDIPFGQVPVWAGHADSARLLCPCAVRFVQADSLLTQLELGHVVLLSSLAYSAAGEVLNCNSYDVAVHAAVDLKADKFICVTDGVSEMGLPQWLTLRDADELIGQRAEALQEVKPLVQSLPAVFPSRLVSSWPCFTGRPDGAEEHTVAASRHLAVEESTKLHA